MTDNDGCRCTEPEPNGDINHIEHCPVRYQSIIRVLGDRIDSMSTEMASMKKERDAAACVNALDGIADPAAELARLQAIERAALEYRDAHSAGAQSALGAAIRAKDKWQALLKALSDQGKESPR